MSRAPSKAPNPSAAAADSETGLVLLVDDEPAIQRFLRPALSAVGYDVVVTGSGMEALTIAAAQQPHLILLDLGLPDIDGMAVLVRLREFYDGCIIVVSGRSRDLDTVAALNAGADDYVEKPFSLAKLIARIRRLRHMGTSPQGHARDVDVDAEPLKFQNRRAFLRGRDLNLTRKQCNLLFILSRNQHRIMSAKEILGAVWGPEHIQDIGYLRVYISMLRRKLTGVQPPLVIETVPGWGYRLTIGGR
jgi:two-component system KDP operon response regulator KdpE